MYVSAAPMKNEDTLQPVAAERQSPILSGFGLDFPRAVIFIAVAMPAGFLALLLRLPEMLCSSLLYHYKSLSYSRLENVPTINSHVRTQRS